jgi:4-diphosphocytidyl-2-C-methyl-D-erythritol kinase
LAPAANGVLEERAPAKINLDLHVVGRRPDGYHEIDSLVVFADLADFLSFEAAPDISLTVGGPEAGALDEEPDNLVLRASRSLQDFAGVAQGARIILHKKIPVAAGLGGGSADAAATLRGLTRLWRLQIEDDDLQLLGKRIGADVPVCLQGRGVRMQGIGDRLTPVSVQPLDLVLANPRVEVPTRSVFEALAAPPVGDVRPPSVARWGLAKNDLEAPACRIVPVISEVLARLREEPDADCVRMSGSGATCFAAFPYKEAAEAAALRLRSSHPGWWVRAVRVG